MKHEPVAEFPNAVLQPAVLIFFPRPFLQAAGNLVTPSLSTILVASSGQLVGNSMPILNSTLVH